MFGATGSGVAGVTARLTILTRGTPASTSAAASTTTAKKRSFARREARNRSSPARATGTIASPRNSPTREAASSPARVKRGQWNNHNRMAAERPSVRWIRRETSHTRPTTRSAVAPATRMANRNRRDSKDSSFSRRAGAAVNRPSDSTPAARRSAPPHLPGGRSSAAGSVTQRPRSRGDRRDGALGAGRRALGGHHRWRLPAASSTRALEPAGQTCRFCASDPPAPPIPTRYSMALPRLPTATIAPTLRRQYAIR